MKIIAFQANVSQSIVHTQNNKTDGIIPFVETQMPFLKNFSGK